MKQRPQRAVKARAAIVTSAVLFTLAGCSGKGAEGSCEAIPACGGDPVGTWNVVGTCQFESDRPYQQPSLSDLGQTPMSPSLAPPQVTPTTMGDWCAGLVYTPPAEGDPADTGKVSRANLWHDAALLDGGTVTFNADLTYQVALNFSRPSATHFSPRCLRFEGATPTCQELATNLDAFYQDAGVGRGVDPNIEPTSGFSNITCSDSSDGGCDCSYLYSVQLSDRGTWAAGGGILTQSSIQYLYNGQRVSAEAPTDLMVVDYCRSGNQLTLSGTDGAGLSEVVGLRSLTLQQ